MNNKTAIITGITGQDGSFLADLLLSKDYKVYGIMRRSSTDTTERIKHLLGHSDLELITLDVCDFSGINRLISSIHPDLLFNTAAQSNVGISFAEPIVTFDTNTKAPINMLEAIRNHSPSTKFLQCSTSELYGDTKEAPQNENTRFKPQSPYGISKMAAHDAVRIYREGYNLFACASICFNHESVLKNAPIMIKGPDNLLDIVPIEDLFRSVSHKHEGLLEKYIGLNVWDGESWTEILKGTCYKDSQRFVRLIQTVGGCCETTEEHAIFNDDNVDTQSKDLKIGDKLFEAKYPDSVNKLNNDLDLVKFIGFVVAEGYISNSHNIRLTGCDKQLLISMANLVINKFGWNYSLYNSGPGGFDNCHRDVWHLTINSDSGFSKWLSNNIYTTRTKEKRIPKFILNANVDVCKSFFSGYFEGDGRKAGHEAYEYKGWTTSSATLCLGLIYILKKISPNQIAKVKCDYRDNNGKSGGRYYYCQLTTDNEHNISGNHLIKDKNLIIDIINTNALDGWFYDLTTESKAFAIGPNLIKIHNSPRRSEQFVTRKITKYVGNVFAFIQKNRGYSPLPDHGDIDYLYLGNLEAKRDWSHAFDVVQGMWLMLQQTSPKDYVLASGQTHSIRELLKLAFSHINISNYMKFVKIDPKFYRPCEVNLLLGDSSLARQELGWAPEHSFENLIKEMVDNDCEEAVK